jgi:tRNA nucleotidyltransferase (CCA-adding enzyme)
MAALQRLSEALGADAALTAVGGCVRDRLLGRTQDDWDLATALRPEVVMARARAAGLKALPTGLQHGTVTVLLEGRPFEITTYRGEGAYKDGRHPESVRLGVSLEEDLARRDFTINAMALPVAAVDQPGWESHLVDPFGGRADLAARVLRAVGDPLERFAEDGLRPLRACRFASQLGFEVEAATFAAIGQRLHVAQKVSVERVFTELTKLLCGAEPGRGLDLLLDSGLLDLWLPELRAMRDCGQNRHHRFDVWTHTLHVVGYAPADPGLRWAALLHDVGKPPTRTVDEAGEAHFYGHEARSLEIAQARLRALKASNALILDVLALVRHHGVYPGEDWGASALRRFLRRLGEDGLDLERWGAFRLADTRGKGFGDEAAGADHTRVMARLRRVAGERPPLSTRDLALGGQALMALAARPGGPWLGQLQGHLLDAVLEDPDRNTPDALADLARAWLHPGP